MGEQEQTAKRRGALCCSSACQWDQNLRMAPQVEQDPVAETAMPVMVCRTRQPMSGSRGKLGSAHDGILPYPSSDRWQPYQAPSQSGGVFH